MWPLCRKFTVLAVLLLIGAETAKAAWSIPVTKSGSTDITASTTHAVIKSGVLEADFTFEWSQEESDGYAKKTSEKVGTTEVWFYQFGNSAAPVKRVQMDATLHNATTADYLDLLDVIGIKSRSDNGTFVLSLQIDGFSPITDIKTIAKSSSWSTYTFPIQQPCLNTLHLRIVWECTDPAGGIVKFQQLTWDLSDMPEPEEATLTFADQELALSLDDAPIALPSHFPADMAIDDWEITPADVAAIEDGKIVPLAAGTATLTATHNADWKYKFAQGQIALTVIDATTTTPVVTIDGEADPTDGYIPLEYGCVTVHFGALSQEHELHLRFTPDSAPQSIKGTVHGYAVHTDETYTVTEPGELSWYVYSPAADTRSTITSAKFKSPTVTTAIPTVSTDTADRVIFYNLQGLQIPSPQKGVPYIKVVCGKSIKAIDR